MRPFPFLRPLALSLAILSFPGCSSWRPAPGSPDPAKLPAGTDEVRVTLSDGSRLRLRSPIFEADSLRAREWKSESNGHERPGSPPRALAPANIATLERRQGDAAKTAGLILGLGFLGVAVAYVVMVSTMTSPLENWGDNAQLPESARPAR